jgi:hypothetical protein
MLRGEGVFSIKPRYLSKSRFKLALECPTKLYYDGKADYANQKIEDTFLMALADGGFQVGELAKQYFPGGVEIKTLNDNDAIKQTSELLKKEQVIIYEAAFRYENLFIRADILFKQGNHIELVEVKAKSYDLNDDSFLTKKGSIKSSWQSYLYDVAFQKYVVECAYPDYYISAYLMMADKTALCPTDKLNQKFRIKKDKTGRKYVLVGKPLLPEELDNPILCRVNVDDYCDIIYSTKMESVFGALYFDEFVVKMADCYFSDVRIASSPSLTCSNCEFKATEQEIKAGLKSGYHECWKESLGWDDPGFLEPSVLDIWNFRKKNQYINEGIIKMTDLRIGDISPKSDGKPGLSSSERQWLQIEKAQANDKTFWIDKENLRREMDKWVYPLHFIDFETAMAAIPFNKGRYPYEGIAFQYSHHILYQDGSIKHFGQYLNAEPGVFPNYDFVRALKKELEQDQGSIFRYAAHENTYLNMIYHQLFVDPDDIPDREVLCSFIRTITESRDDKRKGPRSMVDMWELVKRYYYDPAMGGSNSIKRVLPAILNSSKYLQDKYSKPIYGADGGIISLNYKDWKWIEYQDGKVIDPYRLLPKLFEDMPDITMELLSDNDELKDGGAALTAYAQLQFEEMSEYERTELSKALLKYCELDTLAMVMIYEGWRDFIG